MRGSYRLFSVFGIDIDIHATFFVLLAVFFFLSGFKGLLLILGIFFFVTIHELSHSLAAICFGVRVRRITLLPIGGIASMDALPKKAYQEFIIAIAGPLSNIIIVAVFYYPVKYLVGPEVFFASFRELVGLSELNGHINLIAYIYWLNLVLAGFNLIPAFPMDGGRIVRSIL